ncbi:MAG: penicillin-binding protein 2 [Patescibacteria group bacterium]|jgi:penicillin-binding protein 2
MWKSHDPFVIPGRASDKKIGRMENFSNAKEVSESFLVGESSLWLGRIVTQSKLNLFFIIFCFLFLSLFGRLFYLQFIKGGEFRAIAEGNRLRLELIPPSRGIIFDRFGVPLVENVGTFSLFFQPAVSQISSTEKEKIEKIFQNIGLAEIEITKLLKTGGYVPVLVKENLLYDEAISLMLQLNGINSLKIIIDPQRKYLENSSLAHLLGFTSRITKEEKDKYLALGYQLTEKIGRLGLEESYQEFLRGVFGKRQIEVDAFGREKKVIAKEAPQNGSNLILGLDLGLQQSITLALNRLAPVKSGAVVALDPRSGKIRAFVSWPTYDSNQFSRGISQESYQQLLNNPLNPLFNRVITGEYPTGSTIKLIMSLAGLAERVIDKNTQVSSTGGVWYDKWFFPDWKAGGHGQTNVIKALAESVNTFFYYLALENFDGHRGLGLDKILSYFSSFGLGKITGIDIAGERPGFLPSKEWKLKTKEEAWYPGDTLHLAIGQGDLLATPLQVSLYTSAIANGGTLYQPSLVEKIINPETGAQTVIEPKIITQIKADQTSFTIVNEGLRATVERGSGRRLATLSVPVAGKTGTAEVSNGNPHSWFTAYLPANNPELVLTVLIEHGGDGTDIAVPIAYDVLNWYITNRRK